VNLAKAHVDDGTTVGSGSSYIGKKLSSELLTGETETAADSVEARAAVLLKQLGKQAASTSLSPSEIAITARNRVSPAGDECLAIIKRCTRSPCLSAIAGSDSVRNVGGASKLKSAEASRLSTVRSAGASASTATRTWDNQRRP
jgi:hypothetical protein